MIEKLNGDQVNALPPEVVRWQADTDWNQVRELENAAKAGDAQALAQLEKVLNDALIVIDPATGKAIE